MQHILINSGEECLNNFKSSSNKNKKSSEY